MKLPYLLPAGFFRRLSIVSKRIHHRLKPGRTIGYIGGDHGNLGDACMYQAASGLFPGLIPFLSAGEEDKLAWLGLSGKRLFSGCLLGGGTLINNYGLNPTRCAIRQGIPLAAIGTGAGSGGFDMAPEVHLTEWGELLNSFSGVGVRGPLSLELLQKIGVSKARIVGDLALLFAQDQLHPAKQDPPSFAFNAIQPHGQASYGDSELQVLTEVVSKLIRRGWRPVPVATHESDVRVLQHILKNTIDRSIGVHQPTSVQELIGLVGPCSVMISMRLHGSVLATCAGVPPVILSYLGKCEDFAASMRITSLLVPIREISTEAILERVNSIVDQGDVLRTTILNQAQHWREELRRYSTEVYRRIIEY